MLDSDLARLYGVEARALNQAVARNRKRFPADFMFQLTPGVRTLRSQIVTSKTGRGGVHRSHGDATERSGDRGSICGGPRSNQIVNHATRAAQNNISAFILRNYPGSRQLPSSRSRSPSPIVRSPPSFPD